MYLSFAGLSSEQLSKQAGAGAKLIAAYKSKYGAAPVGSYPLYGVAAVQVIMAAIAKSDGTRASVTDQVLNGSSTHLASGRPVRDRQGDHHRSEDR